MLRKDWSELWLRSTSATPFQSPEWLIPWWKYLGEGELWVLAVRQQERLVSLAPFFIHHNPESQAREVLFLGAGITDYLDVLLEPGSEGIACAAIADHLSGRAERWDTCDWQQLRSGSLLLRFEVPPGCNSEIAVQEVCPVLMLPGNPEELRKHVPARMLEKFSYYRRRLNRVGPNRVDLAGPDNFAELFHKFLELHQVRWASRGQNGVLKEMALEKFHREAAVGLLSRGLLRLYGLRVGNRIIATLYGFCDGKSLFFYLSGFDPEFASYSPGSLIIGQAIQEAIREGATEFDFLRGREAYKYMWGARGRLNYRRRVWRSGGCGQKKVFGKASVLENAGLPGKENYDQKK